MKDLKHCPLCKKNLLLNEFNKNASNNDGLQGECRKCSNARARKKTRDKNIAKLLKTITVKGKIKKQVKKDSISDLQLAAKAVFLKNIARYMADEDADYRVLASRAGYSGPTVSSYLNGPKNVSERFISQVSKKIPVLSMEWITYKKAISGEVPEEEIMKTVVPALPNDKYIVFIDDEILDPGECPMDEQYVREAVNDFLQFNFLDPGSCVIEVYKLHKMGYELNTIHDLTIYAAS